MKEAATLLPADKSLVNKPYNFRNLSGITFGRLTAISAHTARKATWWECLCECGETKTVRAQHLVRGKTKSCGCLRPESTRRTKTTHGKVKAVEYYIWSSMIQRCSNPKNKSFENYGGRGISVSESWLEFESFFADMGKRPTQAHSLGRVNNDANYSRQNCRWETRQQQASNKTNSHHITIDGVTLTLSEWCRRKGINRKTVSSRISSGWADDRAITTPI